VPRPPGGFVSFSVRLERATVERLRGLAREAGLQVGVLIRIILTRVAEIDRPVSVLCRACGGRFVAGPAFRACPYCGVRLGEGDFEFRTFY